MGKIEGTLEKLEKGSYTNTKTIALGGVPFSARDVLVKAPLLARLNAYYVGGTGEGKTQLANDLKSYFGDSACYTQGRPDFQPDELFREVNWQLFNQIREGNASSGEIEKLTDTINKKMFYVDELNRCPPIVQNYFFDFFDGKLIYKGKILPLGKDGYSVGFASGNLGDGEYVGISDSDRALLDRMHLIVGLDHPDFTTTAKNDLYIFSGKKKDPRANVTAGDDISKEIIKMHNEFAEQQVNPLYPLLAIYMHKGLDFLEQTKAHSKKAIQKAWYHSNVDGVRQDTDESILFPLSKRACLSAICLASALENIAKLKKQEVKSASGLFLDSLKLTIPYSGVIHPQYIAQKHMGDVYSAFDEAMQFTREQVTRREENLEEAVLLSHAGIADSRLSKVLKEITKDSLRWNPVAEAIKGYAKEIEEDPTNESQELKATINELHQTSKETGGN